MLDILRGRAGRISVEGCRLLKEFSGMHPKNKPGDSVVFISPSGNQFWNGLPPAGKQVQTQLLPEIDRFSELVRVLSRNLPTTAQQGLTDTLEQVRNAVEQSTSTWWKTPDEAVQGFRELADGVVTTLAEYFGATTDTVLAIPDTNALIANPDIEHWQFDGFQQFQIVLTPTVLGELDKLKVNHRNQAVRDKATEVIRRIKEYRRRGILQEGVPIVKDLITLRAIAPEPNMSQTLSWFDPNNNDDRFLATAVEIIRDNLRSTVFLVTSDINMQNKAHMAGIPFREVPPEPVRQWNCTTTG